MGALGDCRQRTLRKFNVSGHFLHGYMHLHDVSCVGRVENTTYVREMAQRDPEARRAAIVILKRGLMTVPEIAAHAGVSRQLVRYWCSKANLNFAKVRAARIGKLWGNTLRDF